MSYTATQPKDETTTRKKSRHCRGGKHNTTSQQPAAASSATKEVIFKVNRAANPQASRAEKEEKTKRKRRKSPDSGSESDRRKKKRKGGKSSRDKYANHPCSSKFGAEYSSDVTDDGPGRDEMKAQMQATSKVPPGWNPAYELRDYTLRQWRQDIMLWAASTELPSGKSWRQP
jgi:hypothetical protein